ncbi:hypothetical protein SZN_01110 [Streptomyces zinciresistens K42]|uniref:Uncharacterized protein n=1 Tax=Streptomyces zinciresistens K42 TaxID=700597 RepID=G2G421_9ACTN|nr:hypothetical protein [Streptomyces zinciresistens]EGX61917.1 hypothetical protein SZN_01110 [Streptomyces zinciresistens K42]
MTDPVLYGVAVQEDEFADEHVIASSYDHEEVLNALREAPFSRQYLVEHTADGWVEAQPTPMIAVPETGRESPAPAQESGTRRRRARET